jgi:Urea transporter
MMPNTKKHQHNSNDTRSIPNEESSLLKRDHDDDEQSTGCFSVYASSTSNRQRRTRTADSGRLPHLKENHLLGGRIGDDTRPTSFGSFFNYINGTMAWTSNNIDDMITTTNSLSKKTLTVLVHFIDWNLRGIGQVYFCNNPVTGALILMGLFLQSYRVATYGILGVFSGTLAALVFNYDRSLIASGLLGYNPFLVGLAIATFHQGDEYVILGIILTCILCTLLFDAMGRVFKTWESPVFTYPFNISTMIYLLFVSDLNKTHGHFAAEFSLWMDFDVLNPLECSVATMRGFGQVFLANNLVTCLLIMIGIAVCSRILFVSALLGGMAGVIFAMLSGVKQSLLIQGLLSYNASLTLAGIFLFNVPSVRGAMMGLLAVMLAVLVQYALSFGISPLGLPVMTFPFCIASLVFVWIQCNVRSMESGQNNKRRVYIPPVPLSSITTPEEHIQRHNILQDAFYLIFKVIHSDHEQNLSSGRKQISPTRKILVATKEIRRNICGDSSTSSTSIQDVEVDRNATNVFKELDTNNSGHITGQVFINYLHQHYDDVYANLANKAFNLFSVGVDGSHIMDRKNFLVLSRVSNHLVALKGILLDFGEILGASTDDQQELLSMDSLNDAILNLTGDTSAMLTPAEYEYLQYNACYFEDGSVSGGSINNVQMANFISFSFLTFVGAEEG